MQNEIEEKNKSKKRKKSKKEKKELIQSTQQNIPISDFYNGLIVTRDSDFICVMEVMASPYNLQKNEEKNKIARNYMTFLEMAPNSLHVKSVSEMANLDEQINEISEILNKKEDVECEKMRREYLAHLKHAETTTVVTRYFFSFGYEGNVSKTSPEYAKLACQWLINKCNSMAEVLRGCGDTVVQINLQEPNKNISEIMYMLYNRNSYKTIPLERKVAEIMQKYVQNKPEIYTENNLPYIPPTEYLAPSKIEFTDPNIVRCDDLYYEFLYVPSSDFPKSTFCGWLTFLNKRQEPGIDIDVFYTKKDPATLSWTLNSSIARQQVAVNDSSDKTTGMTYESRDKLQSAMYLRQGIASGDTVYDMQVVITVIAPSLQELHSKVQSLMNYAIQQGTKLATVKYQPEEVFKSVMMMPTLSKELYHKTHRNALTAGAASTYLYTSFQMICKNGIYIADDMNTGSPVIIDFFDTLLASNPHIFVVGETGAGKSVAIKLMSMRARVKDSKVFVVVPEKQSEFKRISDEFNGQFISMGPGSPSRLNIFDIAVPDKETIRNAKDTEGVDIEASSWLSQKLPVLVSFFQILAPDEFSSLESQEILNDALVETYAKYGITEDNDSLFVDKEKTKVKEFPIINDLLEVLRSSDNPQRKHMATLLNIFSRGTYSFFNGRTNVNVTNNFFVIGLENNSEKTLGLATFAATEYIWGKIKSSKLERKFLIMDEWWKMAYNAVAAERTMEIARLARSYNCSLVIATQRMADVMALENGKYGEAVLNSCATKIILHSQTKDLNNMQKIIQLTDTEKDVIANFKPGQALLLNSLARMRIAFRPSQKEQELTFTDSATLKRLSEKKRREEAERKRLEEKQRQKQRIVQVEIKSKAKPKVIIPTVIKPQKIEKNVTEVKNVKPSVPQKDVPKVVEIVKPNVISKAELIQKAKHNQVMKHSDVKSENELLLAQNKKQNEEKEVEKISSDSFENMFLPSKNNRQSGRRS